MYLYIVKIWKRTRDNNTFEYVNIWHSNTGIGLLYTVIILFSLEKALKEILRGNEVDGMNRIVKLYLIL